MGVWWGQGTHRQVGKLRLRGQGLPQGLWGFDLATELDVRLWTPHPTDSCPDPGVASVCR